MAGCGCKGNQNPPPPPPPQNPSAAQQNRVVSEDVKSSIRKTIEKYYNVNKTQK
jgi:hypothetical protein